MSMLSAKIQAGFEPIAGYVLKEKLGAGGYGDVWSADAPGGLQKAIKIVHGNIEESRASSELKSLQRIRQVNHPFILSLERIEVVESQLIIVTELAQCSLLDRFVEYREKGFAGIARDRLLGYLRDAAEGLDFLCQKHDLQHLDVKPGNLLLVSDRIKVADFGLVKDLQSHSQSLMGGLTPTYAAPEMFDGRPGRFSDQYSLAIVYQEMLTGGLPFRGRTTAQLANEHLHKAPALDELPAAERSILAKALSKKPHQRFSDCREMIMAIENAASNETNDNDAVSVQARGWSPNLPKNKNRPTRAPSVNRTAASSLSSSRLRPGRAPQSRVRLDATNRKESYVAKEKSPSDSPSEMVIAIGGMAIDAVTLVRKQLATQATSSASTDRYLILDTDSRSLEPLVDRGNPWRLDYGSVVHLPIKSPNYYREETDPFPQLSRRWVYNIPRSHLTEGVRPLGMLALLDHASLVFDRLLIALTDLAEQSLSEGSGATKTINVRLISSLMGGTGSAMVAELGFMLRQAAESLGLSVQIEFLCTCASPCPTALGDLASASAMASLLEINHYFRTGGLHPGFPTIPECGIHRPPFDHVRVLYGGQLGNEGDRADTARELAALLLARPKSGESHFGDADSPSGSDGYHWISTIRPTILPVDVFSDPQRTSAIAMLQAIVAWISSMNIATKNDITTASIASKQSEKIKFLVGDLFRECNWNAQAWVCECMKSIVPDREVVGAGNSESGSEEDVLKQDHLDFLPLISEQLGIPVENAARGVRSLLDRSIHQLEVTLREKWLLSPAHWEAFPVLLESIQVQLKLNANSLFTVAQRLSVKHDEMIEMLSTSIDANRDLDAELSKLAIESTFHVVAGRLLVRIASQLDPYRRIWEQVSRNLCEALSMYCEKISSRVAVRSIDKLLQTKTSMQSDALLKACHTELRSIVIDAWGANLVAMRSTVQVSGQFTVQPIANTLDALSASLAEMMEKSRAPEAKELTDSPTGTSSHSKTLVGALGTSPSSLTTGATSNQNQANVGDSLNDDPYDVDAKLAAGIPQLVDFGSQLKRTLVISGFTWSQLPDDLQARIESQCSVELREEYILPTLLCESSGLNLDELIDRVWMPTDETWQLVPRILSRVDVEWMPFNLVSQEA